jgi:hypothetical protein
VKKSILFLFALFLTVPAVQAGSCGSYGYGYRSSYYPSYSYYSYPSYNYSAYSYYPASYYYTSGYGNRYYPSGYYRYNYSTGYWHQGYSTYAYYGEPIPYVEVAPPAPPAVNIYIPGINVKGSPVSLDLEVPPPTGLDVPPPAATPTTPTRHPTGAVPNFRVEFEQALTNALKPVTDQLAGQGAAIKSLTEQQNAAQKATADALKILNARVKTLEAPPLPPMPKAEK